jgi:hypothetical protein
MLPAFVAFTCGSGLDWDWVGTVGLKGGAGPAFTTGFVGPPGGLKTGAGCLAPLGLKVGETAGLKGAALGDGPGALKGAAP